MENLDRLLQLDPKMADRMAAIEAQTQQIVALGGASRNGTLITIPTVVHVVWNTNAENLSVSRVQSQIQVLTEDFRRMNSDAVNTPAIFQGVAADTEIEFCLATVDPQGAPTTGITYTQTSVSSFGTNDNVKFASSGGHNAWPAGQYMNIWVCDLSGGLIGYAQFPGGPTSTDGIVCDYAYFGLGATPPFNLGRTATHEAGHWLNLRHIWGDGGCGVDDLVADTPLSDAANYGCAAGHVSCGSTDMVQNYMDYSDDSCMNVFTQGQKTRMQALFSPGGARFSILSSPGCGPVSSTPLYQTNSAAATLTLNGLTGTSFSPAITNHGLNEPGTLSASSNTGATAYDMAVVFSGLVPSTNPLAIVTANDQVVNVPIGLGVTFFNSGTATPNFIPWGGNFSLPYNSGQNPFTASFQMIKFNAANPDGFSLSQGAQMNVSTGGGISFPSGPSGDDDSVLINLSSTIGSFSYYGQPWTGVYVISNGRLVFGAADTDYAPSVSEITGDNPFLGLWTDLDPSSGGNIDISAVSATRMRVAYNNVRYYAESTTVNFAVELDSGNGQIVLDGLQGVPANPVTNTSAPLGDRQCLGITNGIFGGALPNQAPFAVGAGGSGGNNLAVFDYCNQSAGAAVWHCGGVWLADAIQAGVNRITFTPSGSGYTWSAQ
ncbi:MAG: hypothetical protein CMJ83_00890 [Planctomycetes bacterium]|nr:hypothetical protein [Planctomycetota bacterium]